LSSFFEEYFIFDVLSIGINNYLGSKEDINILGLNKFPLNLEVEV